MATPYRLKVDVFSVHGCIKAGTLVWTRTGMVGSRDYVEIASPSLIVRGVAAEKLTKAIER